VTTRQRLIEDVDSWLARDDISVSDAINSIILLAEDYISTDVRLVTQERSTTLMVDGRRVQAPANYLTYRVLFLDGRRLEYKTPEAIRESPEWRGGGPLASFSIEGGEDDTVQFVFAPAGTAENPVEVELLYFARIPSLVANGEEDDPTNWLLQNHYSVYLYATLRAAAEWVQEEQLEDRYKAKYDECVARLSRSENRKRFGAGAKVTYGSSRTVV